MERKLDYEVVVLGGGSAGIAAGIAAAKTGAKTIILERHSSFGGAATNGGINTYCGFYTRGEKPTQVVYGIGNEVLERLHDYGVNTDYIISKVTGNVTVRFDPETLKLVLDDMIRDSECDALLHAYVYDAEFKDGKVTALYCSDDMGKFRINGKVFVDASGDANLVNLAGIRTEWGDEQGRNQLACLAMRFDNMPVGMPYTFDDMEEAIKKGKRDGLLPMDIEKGMLWKNPDDHFGYCTIDQKYLPDLYASTLTDAEMDLRRQARNYVTSFRRYIPSLKDIYLTETGPNISVRGSRRIIGEVRVNGKDMLSGKKREDRIGRGGWSPDIHTENDLKYLHIADNDYYDIPLGCLRVKDAQNIWACGRTVSSDFIGHASLRVMGTSFVTGQAAGTAAALQAKTGKCELKKVQDELVKQGAML